MSAPAVLDPSPFTPHPFRIIHRREEIPGCVTFQVEPSEDGPSSTFAPGQFYMIYVFGKGEVPISVSGDPAEPTHLTFTIMGVGQITKSLCAMDEGDIIGLRGPFGSIWPIEETKDKDLIIMAGGLGLAPLRPIIYHRKSVTDRHTHILYGSRTSQSILYPEQIDHWQGKENFTITQSVDHATRDWPGHVGVVTDLLQNINIMPSSTAAMICGPEIMMRFCAYALMDKGLAAQNIYISMERNMKCALKLCGRCQYGPYFICKDGPVFSFDRVEKLLKVREV